MPSLGDAIYCRPFVRALSKKRDIWVETKWPDLYGDIRFCTDAPNGPIVIPRYDSKSLIFKNIIGCIEGHFPPEAADGFAFDLPEFTKRRGRYAVIRAPTLRRDFYAPARNPDHTHIRRAAEILGAMGIVTVGVGRVSATEWFDGYPPDVDCAYWRGELSVPDLMGLVSGAALIVAGPGWTVPASVAYDVPHVIIYGGAAKWNALDKLTDPRMGNVRIATVEPDKFCRSCKTVSHKCDKTITDFDRKFIDAVDRAMCL